MGETMNTKYLYLPDYSSHHHNHHWHTQNHSWPRKRHDPFHAGQLQYDHIFTDSQRRHGAVLLHIGVCVYTFYALAILCEEYFCQSLERLCRKFAIPSDVAGATFMAAGSSMPTLLISIISVFMGESELGLGTIVGSTLFNILFVLSLCALFTCGTIHIRKWSLIRDSTAYVVHLTALMVIIADGLIHWYEAISLLLLYGLYIIFVVKSAVLEKTFDTIWKPKIIEKCSRSRTQSSVKVEDDEKQPELKLNEPINICNNDEKVTSTCSRIFEVPNEKHKIITWLLLLPIRIVFYYTIPDVRKIKWEDWYILSFTISITWMAVISYILVWAVAIIGETLRIPQAMMGLTLLAAGSSVPDAISSVIVARKGEGDMALANCVGSNVFDIICLAFPWIIATSIICPNSVVHIDSGHMIYTGLTLFATIITCVGIMQINQWQLTKRAGISYFIAYIVFLAQCSIIEMLPLITSIIASLKKQPKHNTTHLNYPSPFSINETTQPRTLTQHRRLFLTVDNITNHL